MKQFNRVAISGVIVLFTLTLYNNHSFPNGVCRPPLGSKATLTIRSNELSSLSKGKYKLILTDISRVTWQQNIITD